MKKIMALSNRWHKVLFIVAAATIGLLLVITIYGTFFRASLYALPAGVPVYRNLTLEVTPLIIAELATLLLMPYLPALTLQTLRPWNLNWG